METARISQAWRQALALREPPVGIAFANQAPDGVTRAAAASPSACTFWKRGQRELFFATAEDHAGCPIGLMTMGFPVPAAKQDEARMLVGTMAAVRYFDPAEAAHLPAIKKNHRIVVYGPLDDFPIDPDLVLLLLTPYQSMLASEALGSVSWTDAPSLGAFGRPGCAALPKAEQIGRAALSLGCIGARTYTDLPQEEMLLVVPAAAFEQATARLAGIVGANRTLASYHAEQRRAIRAPS